MNPSKFKIEELVEWTSQAGGHKTTKRGAVKAFIPAGVKPEHVDGVGDLLLSHRHRNDIFHGGPRNDESYVVLVPGKTAKSTPFLYWPLTSVLKSVVPQAAPDVQPGPSVAESLETAEQDRKNHPVLSQSTT